MKVSVCITTLNRPAALATCLQDLWNSSVKPQQVIVSDDSRRQSVQQQNRKVAEQYPHTHYLIGPGLGVCANRNNAVSAVEPTEFVAFVDDDVCLDQNFIALALERYAKIPLETRNTTIISGITCTQDGEEVGATKLSWRGYFCVADIPKAVNIHATVFPWVFFQQERWDENIFFGYEDAELCLRALRRGYHIVYCPELRALHTLFGMGTLTDQRQSILSEYDINIEAARLYVGIKRYKDIAPNLVMLIAFVSFYISHMTLFLLKHGALDAWPRIFHRSNITRLFGAGPTESL